MKPEGGGAYWAFGRPGWSADPLVVPTDLPFVAMGCPLGPLVIGTRIDFFYVGSLL